MSKDVKPKQRLGHAGSRKRRIIIWVVVSLACAGGVFAALRYTGTTEVEVPMARVRKGDFIISVRTRGEIKSTRSIILTAPQVPSPRIVKLAESGRAVHKGETVVEFDPVQQEQNLIEKDTSVKTAQSQIEDTRAAQKIDREADAMNLMSSEYNVERSKLEASKAEILSEIDGAKNRIDVGVAEGALSQVKTTIKSRAISQEDEAGHGTGQDISLDDGDQGSDRRDRQYPSEFPFRWVLRTGAAALQRGRP